MSILGERVEGAWRLAEEIADKLDRIENELSEGFSRLTARQVQDTYVRMTGAATADAAGVALIYFPISPGTVFTPIAYAGVSEANKPMAAWLNDPGAGTNLLHRFTSNADGTLYAPVEGIAPGGDAIQGSNAIVVQWTTLTPGFRVAMNLRGIGRGIAEPLTIH